jgi:hypothetical protein
MENQIRIKQGHAVNGTVGTRSSAAPLFPAGIGDAVERVPTVRWQQGSGTRWRDCLKT